MQQERELKNDSSPRPSPPPPYTIEALQTLESINIYRDEKFYPSFLNYQKHPMVLGKRVNPVLVGQGTLWPNTRQGHVLLVKETPTMNYALIMSEGLSDFPTAMPNLPSTGFGFEVFGEFPIDNERDLGLFSMANKSGDWVVSWQALFTDKVTQILAASGPRIVEMLKTLTALSLEIPKENFSIPLPDQYVLQNGRCAVMVFLTKSPYLPDGCDLPTGRVELVAFRLITQSQLDQILAGGEVARVALHDRFIQNGTYHLHQDADFRA